MFQLPRPVSFGFVLLLVAPALGAQIPDGLTAYWDFDNNLTDKAHGASGTASTVADHLSLQGTTAGYTANGKFGPAYSNSTGGNGHAETNDSADVDENGDTISISAWFRANNLDKGWQAFIVKGEGDSWRLHRQDSGNTIAWYGGAPEIYNASRNVNDGNWHHLVATQDPVLGAKLYIDGTLAASGPADPIANNTNPLMIGENPDVDGRNWKGDIDDVGIWNRALTAPEVTQLWNGGTGTPISSFLVTGDNDNDGLPGSWELANGLDDNDNGSINPANGPNGDPDGDGLNNLEEYNNNTLANNPDTDQDGFEDGFEISEGTDPNDVASRPAGLILYYPFDLQNGNVVASETGGRNGTITGGGTYVPGQPDYGTAFQGNRTGANDARVGTNQTANELALGGTSYTAMAWVKWAGTSGGEDHMVFGMDAGQTDQLHHGIRADEDPNVDNLHFGHWGTDIGNAGTVPPNTWTHLAFSLDGPEGRVFVNGVETASQSLGALFPPARGKEVMIGFMGRTGMGSFNGAIDEVKIFNIPLSAAEISEQMVPPSPPVANDDSLTMHHDGKVRYNVTANDRGGIKRSTVQILSGPTSGNATAMGDGTILYEHTAGAPATDTFTYQIENLALDDSDTATVTVNFTSDFRFDTNYSKMPLAPPPTALVVEDAFPGLTFDSPHDFNTVPGDSNKLFVAEGDGRVWLVPDVTANPTDADKLLILDVTSRTNHDDNEKAFKGIALHPDWANNGYLYVTYNTTFGTSRLSRFTCQTTSPFTANPNSEQILIDQVDIGAFHNIGTCEFGADGYLYASFGDEGTQGDGYSNSQYIDKNMWCSIVRLDVDKKPGSLIPNPDPDVPRLGGGSSGEAHYAIPPDNPFIGVTSHNGVTVNPTEVRTEMFITGVRNAFQFHVEDADDNGTVDEVWVGDVGRGALEEITVFTKGENGGWSWREGTSTPTDITGDRNGALESNSTLKAPLWEYTHGGGSFQGNSVIAGFLYKDTEIPSLTDKFLAVDFISGNIWSIERTGGAPIVERLGGELAIVAIKPDPSGSGDVLLLDRGNTGGNQGVGKIRRLTIGASDTSFPKTIVETGFFADLTDLTPQPGGHLYNPMLRFWSDFAEKTRWFLVENSLDQMTYSKDGNWTYPAGTVWVKHFDYPTEWESFTRTVNGQPVTDRRPTATSPRRRIETRYLVKTATGAYGVSYRWANINSGVQDNATLADDGGEGFDIDVTLDAVPGTIRWEIPTRSSCLTCHTPEAGHALSFNTRQLNNDGSLAGVAGNYLSLLDVAGYLGSSPGDPAILPRHVLPGETRYSLEARVRSWLDVNCAYCHKSGGTGGGNWDGRLHLTLDQTGVINGVPVDGGLSPGDLQIVPGDADKSIIYNRAAEANGYSRMPPLATTVIDLEGAQLLADWINQELQPHTTYREFRIAHFGNDTSQEGEPGEDPDRDGRDNNFEWLTNTDPDDPDRFWRFSINGNGGDISLEFPGIGNRQVIAFRSSDLRNWSRWEIPGNDGTPLNPAAIHVLTGPRSAAEEFFRFEIEER